MGRRPKPRIDRVLAGGKASLDAEDLVLLLLPGLKAAAKNILDAIEKGDVRTSITLIETVRDYLAQQPGARGRRTLEEIAKIRRRVGHAEGPSGPSPDMGTEGEHRPDHSDGS